jgi:hypothetical protein
LEQNVEDEKKCHLIYILWSGEEYAISMKRVGEERIEQGSKTILTIPSFAMFITGDLAYYADALEIPNSSSYWCPYDSCCPVQNGNFFLATIQLKSTQQSF